MKKVCPNNPEHNKFVTTAYEVHDWVVDGNGEFIEDRGCTDISHRPDHDNEWTCAVCGATAIGEKSGTMMQTQSASGASSRFTNGRSGRPTRKQVQQ